MAIDISALTNSTDFLTPHQVKKIVYDYKTNVKPPVYPQGVSVSLSKTTATEGETVYATATITPPDHDSKRVESITWEADGNVNINPQNGIITARTQGTATITCRVTYKPVSMDDSKRIVVVGRTTLNVIPATVYADYVVATLNRYTCTQGDTVQATAVVYPTNASNRSVTWRSSAPSVAGIDALTGKITTYSAGSVYFIATAADGSGRTANTSNLQIAAKETKVSNIVVSVTPSTVTAGGTAQASATVYPTNADNRAVTWSISPTSGANINAQSGAITTTAQGNYTVTATAQDGSEVSGQGSLIVQANNYNGYFGAPNTSGGESKIAPVVLRDNISWDSYDISLDVDSSQDARFLHVNGLIYIINTGSGYSRSTLYVSKNKGESFDPLPYKFRNIVYGAFAGEKMYLASDGLGFRYEGEKYVGYIYKSTNGVDWEELLCTFNTNISSIETPRHVLLIASDNTFILRIGTHYFDQPGTYNYYYLSSINTHNGKKAFNFSFVARDYGELYLDDTHYGAMLLYGPSALLVCGNPGYDANSKDIRYSQPNTMIKAPSTNEPISLKDFHAPVVPYYTKVWDGQRFVGIFGFANSAGVSIPHDGFGAMEVDVEHLLNPINPYGDSGIFSYKSIDKKFSFMCFDGQEIFAIGASNYLRAYTKNSGYSQYTQTSLPARPQTMVFVDDTLVFMPTPSYVNGSYKSSIYRKVFNAGGI